MHNPEQRVIRGSGGVHRADFPEHSQSSSGVDTTRVLFHEATQGNIREWMTVTVDRHACHFVIHPMWKRKAHDFSLHLAAHLAYFLTVEHTALTHVPMDASRRITHKMSIAPHPGSQKDSSICSQNSDWNTRSSWCPIISHLSLMLS